MRQRNFNILVGILVVALLALVLDGSGVLGYTLDIGHPITVNQGLDLQGGVRILLQAVPTDGAVPNDAEMNAVRQIIEARVNGGFGVREPQIQTIQNGNQRFVSVELPGAKVELSNAPPTPTATTPAHTTAATRSAQKSAASRARGSHGSSSAISGTGALSATGTVTASNPVSSTTSAANGKGATSLQALERIISGTGVLTLVANNTTYLPVGASTKGYPVLARGTDLNAKSVSAGTDNLGNAIVTFSVNEPATTKIGDYTSAHVSVGATRYYMGVAIDDKIVSDPYIQGAITTGSGQIGTNSLDEANALATQLRYGALPVPLKIVSVNNVSASLGPSNVRASLLAGAVGLFIVVLFMAFYYRLPGLVADAALIIYALVALATFKAIPVTFTLAGIAGFILSIGMAVDANILIFERVKEELRGGHSIGASVEAGFSRAWPSIRDSNVSTMITCVILWYFGSTFGASIIVGFATTLGIGVVISMLTAFLVSRTFLRVVVTGARPTNRGLFGTDAQPQGAQA